MIEISPIQPKFGTSAPAPTLATAAKDYPSLSIEGKETIEPGQRATYRAITNAKQPVSYKWTISLPNRTVIEATTESVTVRPTVKGSLNLILTVTDKEGNSNEVTWTIQVGRRK